MSNPTYRMIDGYYTWEQMIGTSLRYPAHTDIIVEKHMVPILPEYFTKRIGDIDGQKADYGASLDDGRGIHVKEYDRHYKIHWDKKDPQRDPVGHLYHDAPHWLAAILVGAAAGIGYGVYRHYKKKNKKK
ncbi:MAG TPA: hypothetical protein VJ792_07265 [Candidatus Nitrosotalea sp.]|nr:hypothetical protein [Candidatus Nitrosotalea sp.]